MLCRINNEYVSTDVAQFEALSRQVLFGQGSKEERIDAFLQMERLYRGELLAGCIYDDIIGTAQQRYRMSLVDAILTTSQLFSEMGNDNNALWFARKAFEADPSREDVYRVLMDVQNRAGQRTSALKTYFACKKYLNEELGILPSQRTTALYQELILDKR
jgi:DNA-binding SARP family transcriptional activator